MRCAVPAAAAALAVLHLIALPHLSAAAPVFGATNSLNMCDARGYCVDNCTRSADNLELDAIVLLDAHPALLQSVGRAVDIMKRYPGTLTNDRSIVHLTLMYICCASPAVAKGVLLPAFRSVRWRPPNISYAHAVCNADGSIILLADAATQRSLSTLVEQFEAAAAARGFVMQRRAGMEAFHTTIGTTTGSFPMQQALLDINSEISSWTPHPVQFDRFWLLSRHELQFWPPEYVLASTGFR